jgi:hypothetical protein
MDTAFIASQVAELSEMTGQDVPADVLEYIRHRQQQEDNEERQSAADSAPSVTLRTMKKSGRGRKNKGAAICNFCFSQVSDREEIRICVTCGSVHHAECWRMNGGCSTYGCRSVRARSRQGARV